MSRVGGMVEALKSVAQFRNSAVDAVGSYKRSGQKERFDIDDPLDRRRRYERAQSAAGSKEGVDDCEDFSKRERVRSGKGSRHEKDAVEQERSAGKGERKRLKREKRQKKEKRREQESTDDELEESRGRKRRRKDDFEEPDRSRKSRKRKESSRRARHSCSSSGSEDGSKSREFATNSGGLMKPEDIANAIFKKFANVAGDLKLLLQTVDSGKAVDVSGLPNKLLAELLGQLCDALNLTKLRDGVYSRSGRSRPTLETLGPFFERLQEENDNRQHAHEAIDFGPQLPCVPNGDKANADPELDIPQPALAESKKDDPVVRESSETARLPTPREAVLASVGLPDSRRRVMGPAMPSADMLAAAAKLTEAQAALREAEEELFRNPLVGPPPASLLAEAESANEAERFEEVTRIMARDVGDAYDVLGTKSDVPANIVKKRYLKLSLLVHPDKCAHPQAQEAFMKLNQAFKDLQDPVKRAEIDRKAQEKIEKEEFEAELVARREAAQWRKLRGESPLPGDEELLRHGQEQKVPARDEWMTDLPPERQAGHTYTQSTAFSRSEKSGRGDTSVWTDNPLQKAEKAKMQYLEAYKQATITAAEEDERTLGKQRAQAAAMAELVDSYNERKRPVPLAEKHRQKQKKPKSGVKQKAVAPDKSWAENHPWKPWDREKDLCGGRQAVQLEPMEVQAQGLKSRFGSSGTERNFL